MSKQYYFSIKARMFPSDKGFSNYQFTGSSMIEAKNKFKASFPNAKIISCVKGCEYIDNRVRPKSNESAPLISGSSIVTGVALAAGAALLGSIFGKSKDQ